MLLSDRRRGLWFGKHWFVIVAVTMLAHGFLLLSDAVIWDGWHNIYWMKHGKWDWMYRIHSECGIPMACYLQWMLSYFPDSNLASKYLSLALLMASGFCVYYIGRNSNFLSAGEALVLSLLAITYPGFHLHGEIAIFFYSLCYTLFLAGALLALRAEQHMGRYHLVLRVLALGCFLVSFTTNSLLVFYFGFLILLFLVRSRRRKLSLTKPGFRAWGTMSDYLLLPFLFWLWKEVFTKRHGFYENYNRIEFSVSQLRRGYMDCLSGPVRHVLRDAALDVFSMPVVWIIVVGFVAAAAVSIARSQTNRGGAIRGVQIFLFGLVIFLMAAFPYILVGQRFGTWGWVTKNSLLLGLPIATILVGFGKTLSSMLPTTRYWISGGGVVLLIAFAVADARTHFRWQAMSVKEQSISYQLTRLPGVRDYSLIEVRDSFHIPRTIDTYPTIVWTYQFGSALGELRCVAFEARDYGPSPMGGLHKPGLYTSKEVDQIIEATTVPYTLTTIDRSGKQGILTIQRGDQANSISSMVGRYLYYRFVRSDKMETFLPRIARIELLPRQPGLNVPRD